MKKWIVDSNGKKLYTVEHTPQPKPTPEPQPHTTVESGEVTLTPVSKSLDKLDDSQD